MAVEPLVDAVAYLNGNGRIKEVGCTDFDGCSASHKEFDGILSGAYASKTNYRNLHSLSHLPYHAQSYGLDGRTAQKY